MSRKKSRLTPPSPGDEAKGTAQSTLDGLIQALVDGVVLWIRQSSNYQKQENTGSWEYQKAQLQPLIPLGVTEDLVLTMDARGESGESESRPQYRALLDHLRSTRVRIVVVAFADRLSRDTSDLKELLSLLKARRGFIVVGGQIFDTSRHADMLILKILGDLAEFDNAQRVLRSLTAKLAKARAHQYPVRLPAGLVWASPTDPAFVDRAHQAGIGEMLKPDALAAHRVRVTREGVDYYVLPFPDRDVVAATRLTVAWLLETGSLSAVVERMRSHPDWPRPGEFPVRTPSPFKAEAVASWRHVVDRPDGREDVGRQGLRDWLHSPALFGVYAFAVPRLRTLAPKATETLGGGSVWLEGAFPGVASPGALSRVAQSLSVRTFARSDHTPLDQRDHLLPNLRCGHHLKGGEVCGLKIAASYDRDRPRHRYGSPRCWSRGHSGVYTASIERTVLGLITGAYGRDELRHTIQSANLAAHGVQREVTELGARRADLERRASALTELLVGASASKRLESVRLFETQLESTGKQIRALDNRRLALDQEAREMRALSKREMRAILDLAGDVPRLLELAATHVGMRRRIVGLLSKAVHIRRVQGSLIWVEAAFPGGARRGAAVFGQAPPIPASIRAFVAHRMGLEAPASWPTLESVEAELARAAPLAAHLASLLSDPSWTADRVLLAAHRGPPDSTRSRPPVAVSELAARRGGDPQALLADVLSGRLGPATVSGGTLVVQPTPRELAECGLSGPAEDETLSNILRHALPAGTDPASGTWLELGAALRELRPTRRSTLARHAVLCRPGMGYQGPRSVYVWLDESLRERLAALRRKGDRDDRA